MPRGIAILLLLVGVAGNVQGGELAPLRHSNPWATFQSGAWKQVRTTTELLGSDGKVSSRTVTETRTSLDAVDDDGIVLRINTTCEIGGHRLPSQPEIVKYTFTGSPAGQTAVVKSLEDTVVTMGERKVPCQVRRIEYRDGRRTRVCLLHLAEGVTPFIIQSQIKTTPESGAAAGETTESKIVSLERPVLLLGQVKNAVHIRTKQTTDAGVTETDSYNTSEVPGGEILAWTKKYDASGKEVRHTTVELLGYGQEVPATPAAPTVCLPPVAPTPLTYIPELTPSGQQVGPAAQRGTYVPQTLPADDANYRLRRRDRRNLNLH
jgi:hypothetical protein